ncbi:YicC/YloC family endoribonuclease [Candidatus Pandoraea novymonadis]|uniref:YicC family protein n=1 Tax=Candidatus Pandoraea novymonadis TaxID=1808959 RepID=A0ABX5FE84_9BURK|nr:YicC/YloC family endoribonuclease [Candidatus Pandoraea novymonadis]PSB91990.1 hypothetical protein BZL35_00214 [Candidatus Pandoraea novymonadis]
MSLHKILMKENHIYSMTGYATLTRTIGLETNASAVNVSIELRSINSRFLDFTFRIPDEMRFCELVLREVLMTNLSRGKVDIRVNVQRSDTGIVGTLDTNVIRHLCELEAKVLEIFPGVERMGTGEILRWPGVLREVVVTSDSLRDVVIEMGRSAIQELLEVRKREGRRLKSNLLEKIDGMEKILREVQPLVPELIERHQKRILDRLKEALGITLFEGSAQPVKEEIADRIRQEVTMYGIRIDICEELTRLETHLKETRHILNNGGVVGKRLDFMMQELNREANTLGSKAVSKELGDASMALKIFIEQMREQVQNLE